MTRNTYAVRDISRATYQGSVLVEVEAALAGHPPAFARAEVVAACRQILQAVAEESGCVVPIYCFMPDRLHLLLHGVGPQADAWKALRLFRQHAGFWLARNKTGCRWQDTFTKRLLAPEEDWKARAAHIAVLPVRAGLAERWDTYPHLGTIGLRTSLGKIL